MKFSSKAFIKANCLVSCLLSFLCFASGGHAQTPTVDLSGKWRFALDRENKGIQDNWSDQMLKDQIALPGVLQSQGFGDEISTKTPWVLSLYDRNWFEREDYKAYTKLGNVKVPFLSQPPRHYIGPAWYQRDIVIPESFNGKRIVLHLERPRWESTVWLDGKRIGSARSLVAPHEFDLAMMAPGKHQLTIRVDTSMVLPYRPDAHSVSDSLGMSWNGIVGKIELRATSPVWIDDAQVYAPSPAQPVIVKVKIGNANGRSGTGVITEPTHRISVPVTWTAEGGNAEVSITFPVSKGDQTWNEFHPILNKLKLNLTGDDITDTRDLSFGFRDIKAVGKEFQLNSRRIYLRGTHHGGDFPLTGYPPTDVAYWRRIFQINKDWGINHVRFHSFCPPEAAFQAADELGIYLQPEPGMWNEVSPGTPMEKMLYEETEAMIKAYGNHPSFLLFSPSNEPKGRWKEAFDKWIAFYRIADPRRLYTNGTGHTEREVPGLAEGTDFLAMQRIGPKMLRGNTAWFGRDYGKSLDDIKVPVVSHELGQWIAYPDYSITKKFAGYMRPGNYEIFRDSLAAKGLLAKNKDFAYASGRYQLECYKEEIEANLRTPGMDGFQLLDLHDYLGQGTALVGLLDAFWEEKGYVNAKEFRRFNSETVPLARLTKRVFDSTEILDAPVEIANFGEKPIANACPYWKVLTSFGAVADSGTLPSVTIPVGKNIDLGRISVNLDNLRAKYFYGTLEPDSKNAFFSKAAYQFKLVVGLGNTQIENDWDFWVYPPGMDEPTQKDVFVTHSWDEAEGRLNQGGKVLYMPRKADLDWPSPPLDTVPVFWNRLMNPQWGRMLGLLIDKKHPALEAFPTDSYFDWQWTEIVKNARAINLDKLPKNLRPIVQPIDDWNRNYKLGLIFEAKVGRGKLLVSAADLENDLDKRLAARQLRASILNYMASGQFAPKVSVTSDELGQILFPTRIMKRLGATIAGTGDAGNAIDGDPNTFWIAGDQKATTRSEQSFVVTFPKAVAFSGFVIMPRQNHREHEGDVREYSISISDDGTNWREIKRASLLSTFDPQTIDLGSVVTSKYIKLVSLSGFGADKTTAIADFAIIYAGPKLPDDDSDLEYKRVKSA